MLGPMKAQQSDDQSTDLLYLYLFGPPRVVWQQQAQAIPRRQVRAVLYYLAIRQYPVSAEHLRFLLWPDTPDSVSCRYLSHLLTHLRRALPVSDVLIANGSLISLNPHRIWSDVSIFRRTVSHFDPSRDFSSLREAIVLYRGSVLDGVSFPWAELEHEIERERLELERLYLATLRALIDEDIAVGDYEAAIAYGHRYLSVDELDEEVYRLLMGLYAMTGNRTSALNQFKCLVEVLDRELGVDPLPDTLALHQNVLQSGSAQLRGPPIELAETRLPHGDVPLVGRKEVLDRLVQVLGRARRGQGGMALVSGETGIGKSRILQECASRFDGEALILAGNCYPGLQAIPYHPIAQISRQLLHSESTAVNLRPELRIQASQVLPEFRVLEPAKSAPPSASLDMTHAAFGKAFGDFLLELSGSRAVVLCLDDLQWADRATLEWLGFLGSRIEGKRLFVLGTYCCKAIDALEKLLDTWAGSSTFYGDFKLSGLDAHATLQLVRSLHGQMPGDEQLALRLQRETAGNPFYMLEVIRGSLQVHRREGDWATWNDMQVPNTVWKAIMVRLSYLTPAARQTLEAAALLGYWFTLEQAQRATALSQAQTTVALDELIQRHLLLGRGFGYRFQHDLIRLAVHMSLNPRMREFL